MSLSELYKGRYKTRDKQIVEIATVKSLSPFTLSIEGQDYNSAEWAIYVPQSGGVPVNFVVGDLVSVIDRGKSFIIFGKIMPMGRE